MNKRILPVLMIAMLTVMLTVLVWTPAQGQMGTMTPMALPTAIVTPSANDATPLTSGTAMPYGYGSGMMGGNMMNGITSGTDYDANANSGCMMGGMNMMGGMGSMGGMSSMGGVGSMTGVGSTVGMPMSGSMQTASGLIIPATGTSFWNLNPWWVFGWVLLGLFVIAMLSGIVAGTIWLLRKPKMTKSIPPAE